jgi:hypothetical protein
MSMNLLAVNVMAIAGAALVAIQPGDAAMPGQPGVQTTASACHIEMAETPEGLLVTAWGLGDAGSNYRMVVTQRTGGGGFDIVQEGDVPAGRSEAALLSDILLDSGAAFSARLSTWNAAGDEICSWHEQA